MIELKEIRKSFQSRVVLNGVSLVIKPGEIVFIIGKSGSGKSVLLKNIVGLLKPDSGEVWVDGQEVSRLDEGGYLPIRRKCGLVFQDPALLDSLTVLENVAFGLRVHRVFNDEQGVRARVAEVLAAVGLKTDLLSRLPGELSYGTQKRVSLARTLALAPQYLLYDEPTTGLDPVATQSVNQLIQTLSKKLAVTSLVVSHDMECAIAIADRIVLLDEGKVAASGTALEIQNSEHPVAKAFMKEAGQWSQDI